MADQWHALLALGPRKWNIPLFNAPWPPIEPSPASISLACHSFFLIATNSMIFLNYSLTRPLIVSRCSIVVIFVIAALIITIITFINVVAVGYELVPFTSTSFNATTSFWYDRFVPPRWRPEGRSCDAATIKLGESSFPNNGWSDSSKFFPLEEGLSIR